MTEDGLHPDAAKVAPAGATPLQTHGRSVERGQPVFRRRTGRWSAEARVVPLEGLEQRGLVIVAGDSLEPQTSFAAVVEWEGPPLPEWGRVPGDRAVSALTETVCDSERVARAVALAALELIDAGEVPFMDSLRAAFAGADPHGWRSRYDALVGEDGRAAAEGYV